MGYRITGFQKDRYAETTTRIFVRRVGGTIIADLFTDGSAKYPDLVGMANEPMRLSRARSATGFVETGVKKLVTADGEVIESQVENQFHVEKVVGSAKRDTIAGRDRVVKVKIIEESEDRKKLTVVYSSVQN